MNPMPTILTPSLFEHARVSDDDDAPVLNAMFQYAENHPGQVTVLDWSGEWRASSTVHVRGDGTIHLAGTVIPAGWAADPSDPVVHVDVREATISGTLRVIGTPSAVYDARDLEVGIKLGEFARSRIDRIEVSGFRRHGVCLDAHQDCVSSDLGQIIARDCGSSGIKGLVSTYTLEWVTQQAHGGDTSVAQYTELTLSLDQSPTPARDLRPGDVVLIGGEPYLVTQVGADLTSIRIYPKLAASPGPEILSCHGAAVAVIGGNATGTGAQHIDVQRCGVGLLLSGLYGGSWRNLTVAVSGIGVQLGTVQSDLMLGGSLAHNHLENTAIPVCKVSRVPTSFSLGEPAIVEIDRWRGLTNRGAAGLNSLGYRAFRGVTMDFRAPVHGGRVNIEQNGVGENPILLGNEPWRNSGTVCRLNPNVQLTWSEGLNRAFGYDTASVLFFGPDAESGPGTITFTAPAGSTVSGGASLQLWYPDPVRLTFVYHTASSDWKIYDEPLTAV